MTSFPKVETTPWYQRVMKNFELFWKRVFSGCDGMVAGILCFLCNSLKTQHYLKVGFLGKTWENKEPSGGIRRSCPNPTPYRGSGIGQPDPRGSGQDYNY